MSDPERADQIIRAYSPVAEDIDEALCNMDTALAAERAKVERMDKALTPLLSSARELIGVLDSIDAAPLSKTGLEVARLEARRMECALEKLQSSAALSSPPVEGANVPKCPRCNDSGHVVKDAPTHTWYCQRCAENFGQTICSVSPPEKPAEPEKGGRTMRMCELHGSKPCADVEELRAKVERMEKELEHERLQKNLIALGRDWWIRQAVIARDALDPNKVNIAALYSDSTRSLSPCEAALSSPPASDIYADKKRQGLTCQTLTEEEKARKGRAK